VAQLKVGERVMSPFTACCGACFYCQRGKTCRCQHPQAQLFGWINDSSEQQVACLLLRACYCVPAAACLLLSACCCMYMVYMVYSSAGVASRAINRLHRLSLRCACSSEQLCIAQACQKGRH
jgi:hypothetical protein